MKPTTIYFRLLSMAVALNFALLARAEQLRVAVAKPEIVASGQFTNDGAGLAALWQSLLTLELSKRDLFAVVEREDLPKLIQEWELRLSGRGATNLQSPWLGADWIIIGRLALTNGEWRLALKVLEAAQGGIEKEFPATTMQLVHGCLAFVQASGAVWWRSCNHFALSSVAGFRADSAGGSSPNSAM